MKRFLLALVLLMALAMVGVFAWHHFAPAGRLCYAEVEGSRWDKETQSSRSVVIRVDDPQILAQVLLWRDAVRKEARDNSLRRLMRRLQGQQYCENALAQRFDRLTLVYENGHRETEQVNVCRTPFENCWRISLHKR